MRQYRPNPMEIDPPPCRCGRAQAARSELSRNPRNPQCHLCRSVAVDHPDYAPDQVAEAGAAWWERLGVRAADASLAPDGRTHVHAEACA